MRALITLLLFAAIGCSHVTVNRSEKSSGAGAAQEISLHSFAWGFVPNRLPAEAEVCPKSKIDSVNLYQDSGDVWLAIVTLGIYVPHRADIVCSAALNDSH